MVVMLAKTDCVFSCMNVSECEVTLLPHALRRLLPELQNRFSPKAVQT